MCATTFCFVVFGLIPFVIGLGLFKLEPPAGPIVGGILMLIGGGVMWLCGWVLRDMFDELRGKPPRR